MATRLPLQLTLISFTQRALETEEATAVVMMMSGDDGDGRRKKTAEEEKKGEGRKENEDDMRGTRESKQDRKRRKKNKEDYKETKNRHVPAAAAAAACAVLVCPPVCCNCIITPFPNISTNNFAVEFSAGGGDSLSPFLFLFVSDWIVSKPTGCKLNFPGAPIAFGSFGFRTS